MNRMVAILCTLAAAAAVYSAGVTNGEPSWETEPHAVIAGADELSWESAPVDVDADA